MLALRDHALAWLGVARGVDWLFTPTPLPFGAPPAAAAGRSVLLALAAAGALSEATPGGAE